MKKTSLKLLFTLLATAFALCVSSLSLFAVTPDDEEDGEEIIILPDIQEGGCHTRTPLLIPIEATLFKSQSLISLDLLFPIDGLTAKLTNITTGQSTTSSISGLDHCLLPVALGDGAYHLEFILNNEPTYHGYFIF